MPDKVREAEHFIVGIGSSAGGLDALTTLLKHLGDPINNVSMVICQHVSPDFKSRLTELLQRHTSWEVTEARDERPLEPATIYVTPPNHHITFRLDGIRLEEYRGEKPVPSIDRLFHSLANEKGSLAIGVVLSGTGSDGSQGMREINAAGGYTLVQDPADAKHGDMPRAVIREERYDKVLFAQDIPLEIRSYVKDYSLIERSHKSDGGEHGGGSEELSAQQIDKQIFRLLEKRTGTNFAKYKPSTIFRRIDRRLDTLALDSKGEYLDYIKRTPKELNKLFQTVLIGVTEFFRDRKAFGALEKQLRQYVADLGERRSIRVWSVGTATGEEAYSIAIMLCEILQEQRGAYNVQIFASDLDERALAIARRGCYPHSALEKVPDDLKEKYFIKYGGHHEVKKAIRGMVLFSRHDITVDPPFLKLDLIVCRNLLIYFNAGLQEEVIRLFHYALVNGGSLFLGKSESTSPRDDFFEGIYDKERVYKRVDGIASQPYRSGRLRYGGSRADGGEEEPAATERKSLRELAQEAYFDRMPHPYVIINSNRDILEVKGSTRLYTELKPGSSTLNLVKLINAELSLELRALISKSEQSGTHEASYIVKFRLFKEVHFVRLHSYPIAYRPHGRMCYLIVFEQVDRDQIVSNKTGERAESDSDQVVALEHELATTKEHLALFTEELETSNEELQGLNEELQSTNEEMKSANEELETSNEELQSTNEELQRANQELRIANDQLAEKEEKLRSTQAELAESLNLYHSLADNFPNGVINVVDTNYTLTFAAGKLLDVFGLTPANVQGTNVLHFLDKPEADKLEFILKRSFAGETASCTVKFRDHYLNMNSIPLRNDATEQVDQVLFTSNDITASKELERSLVQANAEKQRVIIREQEALRAVERQRTLLGQLCREAPAVIAVVRGPKFLYEPATPVNGEADPDRELVGKSFYEVMPALSGSKVERALRSGYATGETRKVTEQEVRLLLHRDGEQISGCFNISIIPIFDGESAVDGLIFYATNVTEVVEAKNIIQQDAQRLREIIDLLPLIAWTETSTGEATFFNERWYSFTGSNPEADPVAGPMMSMDAEDVPSYDAIKRLALERREPYEFEARFTYAANDTYRWHLLRVVPVLDDGGELAYWIGTAVDTNEQKLLGLKKDEFLNVASHELKTPLTAIQGYHELLVEALLDVDGKLPQLYLGKMGNSIRRINKLIAELLSVSRIETGDFQLDLRKRDLRDAVREAVADLDQEGSRIRAVGEGVFAEFDQDRIVQAIENLVSNALKFSPPDSEVVINVARADGTAMVEVIDRGAGISAADQADVFKRYFRAASTQQVEGMGLGLYITRQIIETHGGTLTLESELGNGSTFTIKLPAS